MIFPQFVMNVLIDDYIKFRKDPSITSQEKANYISVALAVAMSVLVLSLNSFYHHSQPGEPQPTLAATKITFVALSLHL